MTERLQSFGTRWIEPLMMRGFIHLPFEPYVALGGVRSPLPPTLGKGVNNLSGVGLFARRRSQVEAKSSSRPAGKWRVAQ